MEDMTNTLKEQELIVTDAMENELGKLIEESLIPVLNEKEFKKAAKDLDPAYLEMFVSGYRVGFTNGLNEALMNPVDILTRLGEKM